MRRRYSLERTLTDLRFLRKKATHPETISRIDQAIGRLKRDIELLDEEIAEAKMIGVRGPAFDGDRVGWLADDFDEVNFAELGLSGWLSLLHDKMRTKSMNLELSAMDRVKIMEEMEQLKRLIEFVRAFEKTEGHDDD